MKKILFVLGLVLVLNLVAVPVVRAEEEAVTFDEVVVTASKYEEKLSETATSMEVIDQEEIQQKNAKNAADLLRDAASVQINDNGGVASTKTISIRGSSSKQVLILIDGQLMNDSQGGNFDFSQIPIEQIERIEILKGSASALYGANALGGVVNIITRAASEEKMTRIKIGYGYFDTKKYNLMHSGSTGKLGYSLILTKKESDGYRDNSNLDQENIFTKLNYDIDNHSNLVLSIQDNNSDKGIPGPITYKTPNAKQEDESTNINLKFNRNTEDTDFQLATYYNDSTRYYDGDTSTSGYSEHDKERTGVDFQHTLYFNRYDFSYGGTVIEEEIKSTDIKNGKEEALNKALFIQNEWDVTNNLNLMANGRYDKPENYDSEFSPQVGAVYNVNSNLNFHLSVGEAYRAPTFDELYGSYPSDSPFFNDWYGNPNLDPETSKEYEVGIEYLNDSSRMELNLFKRYVEDLINGYYYDPQKGYNTAKNVNSAKISGVEILLSRYITDQLSANINYSYLDSKDEKTENRLAYKPYHNFNIGLNYDRDKLSSSLTGELVADRTKDLPSYFVVDFKISRQLSERVNVSAEINNLLDREYQVQSGYPMPGRNFMLNTEIKF